MSHGSKIVHPAGPDAPHAFDNIPLKPRNGMLDARCPVCRGHGEWNREIDLISFRCKRAICGRCQGAGWVETGSDPIGIPDIELSPDGNPQWVVRYLAEGEVPPEDPSGDKLLPS